MGCVFSARPVFPHAGYGRLERTLVGDVGGDKSSPHLRLVPQPSVYGYGINGYTLGSVVECSLISDVLSNCTEIDPGGLGPATPPTAETTP